MRFYKFSDLSFLNQIMGASETCCNSPITAVNRELRYPNGTASYAPGTNNQYNDIEQELLIERKKTKSYMQNEKVYIEKMQALAQQNKALKQKLITLSKTAKSDKKQLVQKTAELKKLLTSIIKLMKSSE
eukprot:195195_1